ncbi:serine-rich adhesin for platelets-like isoform X2 [Mytilus trossulus]|uniref:serine-rich adhesin for platelets-like isoform X2 n=1 Tax=Mytilus trossulus TaxID=6551 RepID=UPI003004134E
MNKFYWLILLSICFPKVYSQCSGSSLVIELQMFTTIYIESPNFQSGNYSQNLNCSWRVISSSNTSNLLYRIRHILAVPTNDILKIFKGLDDTGNVLIDTTNNDSPNKNIPGIAIVEGLYVQFTSDDDLTNDGKGFTIDIIESSDMSGGDCSKTSFMEAESSPKFITSPNFPINYQKDTDCSWNISSTDGSVIVISVVYMDIEIKPSDSCYDYLIIGDSGQLCAQIAWHDETLYKYNNSVSIIFKSDNQGNRGGFVLSYMMLIKEPNTTANIEEQNTSTQPASTSFLFTTITGHETSSDSSSSSTQTLNSSMLSTTENTETQTTDTDISSKETASTSSLSITTSSLIIASAESSTKLENTSLLFSTTELPSMIDTRDQSTSTKDSTLSLLSTTNIESQSSDTQLSSTPTGSTSLLSISQTTDNTDSSTWSQSTIIDSPTTIDGVTTETSSISSSIAFETTNDYKHQSTTTTTSTEQEVENKSPVSSAATAGIITTAIIGVAGLGALLAVIAYLMVKKTGGKHDTSTKKTKTKNTRVPDNTTPS